MTLLTAALVAVTLHKTDGLVQLLPELPDLLLRVRQLAVVRELEAEILILAAAGPPVVYRVVVPIADRVQ